MTSVITVLSVIQSCHNFVRSSQLVNLSPDFDSSLDFGVMVALITLDITMQQEMHTFKAVRTATSKVSLSTFSQASILLSSPYPGMLQLANIFSEK